MVVNRKPNRKKHKLNILQQHSGLSQHILHVRARSSYDATVNHDAICKIWNNNEKDIWQIGKVAGSRQQAAGGRILASSCKLFIEIDIIDKQHERQRNCYLLGKHGKEEGCEGGTI